MQRIRLADPALAQELDLLSSEEQTQVAEEFLLQERAAAIASELGVQMDEVRHQLKQLLRTPTQRLRLGLTHGRR